MKFLSLGLDRYGRFTDRELAFAPAPITLIHGANEAGKTTTLAAITDVLFGIEERSRFNFLHDYKAMRLSARIAGADGQELAFARLKRRNAALVDPASETPLPEDCLAPFLGGHDRRAFLEIFGLDQRRLREGGRALINGGGDLAEALLVAAPGLGQVVRLRDTLKDSAGKIFNPDRRNANHEFYAAFDDWKQTRSAIEAQEIRIDEVRRLTDAARAAAEARQAAVGAASESERAAAQAQMLLAALKHIHALDAEAEALAALGPLPRLPPGTLADARARLAAHAEATHALARAEQEEAAAAEALAALPQDGAVAALEADIRAADEERAAVAKELLSLPKRQAEVTAHRATLARIAHALEIADAASLPARLPAAPLMARAEKLAGRMEAAAERTEALRLEAEQLSTRRRQIAAAAADMGHAADPAPQRLRLEALDGAEDRARRLRTQEEERRLADADLAERVARLALGLRDVEDLGRRSLPDLSAAETALRRVREETEAARRLADETAQLEAEAARIEARLATLNAGRPAPTAAAIDAARGSRDAAWADLRPLAHGTRPAQEADRETAARLEARMADADRLADERQTESTRLADLARAELDKADCAARLAQAARQRAVQDTRLTDARNGWAQLWHASGLDAPANDTVLAALREAETIRQARTASQRMLAALEDLRATVVRDQAEIAHLRTDLGLPPLNDGPPRMADIRTAVAEREARFQSARDLERDRRQAEEAAAGLTERSRRLQAERTALAGEAAEVWPALALRAEAGPEEARAALTQWREAASFAAQLATAEQRVAGIERDKAEFIAHVAALAERLGLDAGEATATAATLSARRERALQMQARAEMAQATLTTRREALAAARRAGDLAAEALTGLLATAGLEDAADLPPLLDRLEAAAACAERIARIRQQLADSPAAMDEAAIRAAIAGQDEPTLARRAAEAADDRARAEATLHAAIEQDTQARATLAELERRTGAAGAAQEAQGALIAVADAMERFTRAHVAQRLLTVAIDRYRERHHNPVVTRASEAFARLTCGRWSGIGIDYDETPPRLAALREGRMVTLDGLSEGTADQLFLALRVAAIEEHARRATPLPFIADDLFVSFDEARTAAGFTLLRELAAVTQVIVLTHHDHLVDVAERTLGDGVATIRL
ncbi:AAA family ATPase [Xanthobacteraceae bacterium A53D]